MKFTRILFYDIYFFFLHSFVSSQETFIPIILFSLFILSYISEQVVRAAGLRAVKQKLCRSSNDVKEFCSELTAVGSSVGFKCVVKPNESAGTDSVFLCNSPEEVEKAFSTIHGHSNGLGHQNDGALCQEFLAGTEFVIDGVSRDGVYKVNKSPYFIIIIIILLLLYYHYYYYFIITIIIIILLYYYYVVFVCFNLFNHFFY